MSSQCMIIIGRNGQCCAIPPAKCCCCLLFDGETPVENFSVRQVLYVPQENTSQILSIIGAGKRNIGSQTDNASSPLLILGGRSYAVGLSRINRRTIEPRIANRWIYEACSYFQRSCDETYLIRLQSYCRRMSSSWTCFAGSPVRQHKPIELDLCLVAPVRIYRIQSHTA